MFEVRGQQWWEDTQTSRVTNPAQLCCWLIGPRDNYTVTYVTSYGANDGCPWSPTLWVPFSCVTVPNQIRATSLNFLLSLSFIISLKNKVLLRKRNVQLVTPPLVKTLNKVLLT